MAHRTPAWYKVDSAGHETVLYSFTGGTDGANPRAGVLLDSAGNLYGTALYGGTGSGVVFKLDPKGHETVLYSFNGGSDGLFPYGGVVRDSGGNLYGTTQYGGSSGFAGVVFKIGSKGGETVLHSFTGGQDGGYPEAGLILDSAGNLYGTASSGGQRYAGVVFKIDSTGKETVLYNFTGGSDGGFPQTGVVRDSAGNLFGTANGGTGQNLGVVYKVDPTGNETVLHNFTGGADGSLPFAGLTRDAAGTLFGTTYEGGMRSTGVVFALKP